jgi:hypothetical protein
MVSSEQNLSEQSEAFDEVLTGEREPRNETERKLMGRIANDLVSARPLAENSPQLGLWQRFVFFLKRLFG